MSIFKNEFIQQQLNKDGFARINLLSDSESVDLINWINEKKVADTNNYSNKNQEYSIENYQENHNYLTQNLSKKIDNFLIDYKIVFSRFIIKKCGNDTFIPAHQDRQFADLDGYKFPSYVLWIPLVDVSFKNGIIGFLKGSHLTYKAPTPPCPDPRVKRFNDESIFNLFPYLSFQSLKAGQAVLFDVKTFHGSLPNFSDKERPAIRIDICHKDAPLFCYFLNKKSNGNLMDKYSVGDTFFIRYPNEKLLEIYENNESISDGRFIRSEPYFLLNKTINQYVNEHSFLLNEKVEYDCRVSIMVEKRRYVTSLEAFVRNILKPYHDKKSKIQ